MNSDLEIFQITTSESNSSSLNVPHEMQAMVLRLVSPSFSPNVQKYTHTGTHMHIHTPKQTKYRAVTHPLNAALHSVTATLCHKPQNWPHSQNPLIRCVEQPAASQYIGVYR